MAQEIAGPDTDHSHDAARSSYQLFGTGEIREAQQQNAGARSQTGQEIIKGEARRSNDAFQPRPNDKEGVEVEDQMERPEVQKERGKHPPVFAPVAHRPWLECTEPM